MAKNKALKKDDGLLDIDFAEHFLAPDDQDDEAIAGVAALIDTSNHQQKMAMELTKLVVEKSTENMDEEKIFLVFKRASKVVVENYPLKDLWENFT